MRLSDCTPYPTRRLLIYYTLWNRFLEIICIQTLLLKIEMVVIDTARIESGLAIGTGIIAT